MGKSIGKSKSRKREGKKTRRDPYPRLDHRGLEGETEIQNQKEREKALKKFGPCNFDANECYTAILMLQSEEDSIIIGALHCLQKFLKKQSENGEMLEELRGLSVLSRHLHSSNRIIQRLSMKCLSLASRAHICKLSIRNMGLAVDLVDLAKSQDEVIQEYAMSMLSNLATLYTGRIQLIQNDIVPTVTELMRHPDADVLRNTLETIWRLLVDPLNTELFLEENIMGAIIKLTESEYPTIQVIALSILKKLCSTTPGIMMADSLGILKCLEDIITQVEMGDLGRGTLKILINMAGVGSVCKKMMPFIGPVFGLISDTSDEKTLILALNLIEKMSRVSDTVKILTGMGFLTKLLELLACDKMEIVQAAVSAAAAVTSTDDIKTKELLLKGIESLLDCMEGNEMKREGLDKCIATLGQLLSSGKEACQLFLEWGGREALVKILKKPENYSEDALLSAISCIHQLGCHWRFKTFIADEEVTIELLDIVKKYDNPQILASTAAALSTILCEPKVMKSFFENNGYDFISKLMNHKEEAVKIGVLPLISILISIPEKLEYLLSKGIVKEMWKKKQDVSRNGLLNPYFKKLIISDLPTKFALTGRIDTFEMLPDGFYEFGPVIKGEDLERLEDVVESEESRGKKIIYVDITPNYPTSILEKNPILGATAGSRIQSLIEQIKGDIAIEGVGSESELVVHIASVVSDNFGGAFQKQWRVGVEMEELEIAMLQTKHKSTIIPLSMLRVGGHRPRAILFKVLAQALGVECTLERGEDGKFWNVILMAEDEEEEVKCGWSGGQNRASFSKLALDGNDFWDYRKNAGYVVDLIYEPGKLISVKSEDWKLYCNS